MGESSHCKGRQERVLDCRPHGLGGKELAARSDALTVIHEAASDWDSLLVYDRGTDPWELQPVENPEVPEGTVLRLQGMRSVIDGLVDEQQPSSRSRVMTRQQREEQRILEALGYTE